MPGPDKTAENPGIREPGLCQDIGKTDRIAVDGTIAGSAGALHKAETILSQQMLRGAGIFNREKYLVSTYAKAAENKQQYRQVPKAAPEFPAKRILLIRV
ncbi:MAG TPA: hypothetical protein PLI53_06820 [Geobacteraceae bacterium]|nr:hypothetical protein [Geobacteraceae bacterium]